MATIFKFVVWVGDSRASLYNFLWPDPTARADIDSMFKRVENGDEIQDRAPAIELLAKHAPRMTWLERRTIEFAAGID